MALVEVGSARPGSAVLAITERFREAILGGNVNHGAFLGSEGSLIKELGVSRPTLRQASRLLEAEKLITVRRGPGGGWFAVKPTHDGVVHAANIVLRSKETTLVDLLQAEALVCNEAARLAARNESLTARSSVLATVEDLEKLLLRLRGDKIFAKRRMEVPLQIAVLSGSPTLELLERVLMEIANRAVRTPVYLDRRAIRSTLVCYRQAAEAIVIGDGDAAVSALWRNQAKAISWLERKAEHGDTLVLKHL